MIFEIAINFIGQIVISFVASAAFSMLFHSPTKHIISAGLTGAFGWLIYLTLTQFFSVSVITASFFATVGLTIIARFLSFIRKAPVTIFLIVGIFPLVPGIGIYSTGYHLFMSDNIATFRIGLETIQIAVVMALGMAMVLSLPQVLFSFKRLKKEEK